MKLGLSVYGTVYSMGIWPPDGGRKRIRPIELMEQAIQSGLEGVEIPESLLENEDITEVAEFAKRHDLFITIASAGYNPKVLKDAVDVAVQLGSNVVRTVVGGADYGGDRRKVAETWPKFLQSILAGLTEAAVYANERHVSIAVENHQDLNSEELIWLCETINLPSIGITLDAGNPLATAEEPMDFARRVAPYIKNVHLKDYTIHLSEEGYRLVRCPIGQGAIDFLQLFHILQEHCPDVNMSIEMGWLQARHTRVLADDYWPAYPTRSARQFAGVMRFVHEHAKPPGDWRTPLEREEPIEAIIDYENHQLAASIAYIVPLFNQFKASMKEQGKETNG